MQTTNFHAEYFTESKDNIPEAPKTRELADGELAIAYLALSDLVANPKNARTHSRSQIQKIADSISAFGFNNPILIDAFGMIVAGHGRVGAAKLLKIQRVPTVCLENLSPAQIRAYILADNRLAESAGWDKDILRIELQNIILDGEIEVELTGFEIPEIDILLASDTDADPEDELPLEIAETRTRPGDLWMLGEHRILCGDARGETSFARLMNGNSARMVFTDPPYNVAIDGHASGNGQVHHAEFAMASGEMTAQEFGEFLATVLGHAGRASADGSIHYVCMDWRHIEELLRAAKGAYSKVLNICVWAKNMAGMGSFYRSQHEFVAVFRKGAGRHRNNVQLGKYGRNRTNVWQYPSANSLSRSGEDGNLLAMHPTVKPIALVADAILDASARGDIVLDPFLGAGTTLLAAERTGRTCFAMEIEPKYVDLAIWRWEQQTGEHAVRITTGEIFSNLNESGGNDEQEEGR